MNQLGLFAKFWQPGKVKTRLAVSIGEQAACEVYRACLFHLSNRLQRAGTQRTIVYSPVESENEFRKLMPPGWKLCPQSTGDLGERMRSFFHDQFDATPDEADSSPRKVVIIGADCPQIGPELIQSAFDRLDAAPVVIGPSTDGGYYLIGMRQQCDDIFSDIQWSTESVYSSTVDRLNDRKIEFAALPPLTDVDDLESLLALKSELDRREITNEWDRSLLDEIDVAIAGSK